MWKDLLLLRRTLGDLGVMGKVGVGTEEEGMGGVEMPRSAGRVEHIDWQEEHTLDGFVANMERQGFGAIAVESVGDP